MNKKSVILHSLLSLFIFTYSCVNVRAYGNPTQSYDSAFWDTIYNVDENRLVAEIPDSNIRLYYIKEELVEDPIIILKKSNITFREFPEYFEVIFKNKKITLDKEGRLTPPYSKEGIGLPDARYEVKNDTLFARVPLAIGVSFAGKFVIKYKFKDDILQMESIDFLDYEI